jgi:putative adhesin
MRAFWEAWRTEIIRGATLFCLVLALGLSIRYLVARTRERVVNRLPEALRQIKSELDADAGDGPRSTAGTWTYRGRLAPKHGLWIRNTRGSVLVEGGKGDSVQISAVKTYRSSDTGSVRVVAVPSDAGLTVCAVWAGSSGDCTADRSSRTGRMGGSDVAVDFKVRLPRGVRLDAKTVIGDIHVAGATAPLDIRTVSGDIDVETAQGPVNIASVNGDVHASIRGFADTGGVSITTVNGSVTSELPPALDADLDVHTIHGSIYTDYPVTVSGHSVKGTLGRGGRAIHVTAVNGSIQLKKASSGSR